MDASVHGYNDVRGLWYPGAGPVYPSAVDVAISAVTVATGTTLNALAADGDDRYGQHDQVHRTWPMWQSHPLGLTEFSPLHNLARYGWEVFLGSGATNAEGLGWPLHAIGDACAPQHVVSTTGWGHRPYENWAATPGRDVLFPPEAAQRKAQLTQILLRSFHWYQQLQASYGNVASLITSLATLTRETIRSQGDWPYDDFYSILALPDEAGWTAREYGRNIIGTAHHAHARGLAEEAVSGILAFLVFASERVPAGSTAVDISCPQGQIFAGKASTRPDLRCELTSDEECPPIPILIGACVDPPGDTLPVVPLPDPVSDSQKPSPYYPPPPKIK